MTAPPQTRPAHRPRTRPPPAPADRADPVGDWHRAAVGRWARHQREAWEATPRQLLDDAGRWRPNPARTDARRDAETALRSVAAVHAIPASQVGPCARCTTPHHRYGPGGNPLCPTCHTNRP